MNNFKRMLNVVISCSLMTFVNSCSNDGFENKVDEIINNEIIENGNSGNPEYEYEDFITDWKVDKEYIKKKEKRSLWMENENTLKYSGNGKIGNVEYVFKNGRLNFVMVNIEGNFFFQVVEHYKKKFGDEDLKVQILEGNNALLSSFNKNISITILSSSEENESFTSIDFSPCVCSEY